MGIFHNNNTLTDLLSSKPVAQVTIKCDIYQGDALPPLLFCIGLNPLSQIISKSGYGYQFQSGATVSHLLYMYDIMLYARNELAINLPIYITRNQMASKRGKMIRGEEVKLPEGSIADVQDSCKYLGIPQANGNHEATRKSSTARCLHRVKQVMKSRLNWRNKVQAINTHTHTHTKYI